MDVTCISDLHGHYPNWLEGGDLLIVAGDLTATDSEQEYLDFYNWIRKQSYKNKIVIAGNHDTLIQDNGIDWMGLCDAGFDYLCDSGTEFEFERGACNFCRTRRQCVENPSLCRFPKEDEGFLPGAKKTLKIWGSPWTKRFEGMNPHCMAFTVDTDEELAEKWGMIPYDTDVLITHSPPACILDAVENYMEGQIENVGSFRLIHYLTIIQPKLHIFGHIHEGYGKVTSKNLQIIENLFPNTTFINASHVNEHYKPVNKPIRIEL
jgi:Icc-related predicted phosphoesterase